MPENLHNKALRAFKNIQNDNWKFVICLTLKKDIFLYVDWIFSPNFKNGVDIKNNLSKHLSESRQLLFLRTVNSEFSIRGSGNIRGWCSWELGTFYTLNKMQSDDKYYIELYKSKNNKQNNKQLDGIKPLKTIFPGRLA